MLSRDQALSVTEGSAAIQAGRDVNVYQTGLSYSEVREVVLDVFRANFYELRGEASETARARAEEVTEAFLTKLQQEHPFGLQKANDPDFQYSLFTVQKEYARSGDKDLGDLLVDLLVDRSKQDQRDILQIVLNESLRVVPKLTREQLSVLSVVFFFRYVGAHVGAHAQFGEMLDQFIAPFVSSLTKSPVCYQHLEFTGCGNAGIGSMSLEKTLSRMYQGLFMNGFLESEIEKHGISIGVDPRFFCTCINNSSRLQVRGINRSALDEALEAEGIETNDQFHIGGLYDSGKMNETEVKLKCIEVRSFMSDLFEVWNSSQMGHLTLTSVGIAIAHANIKRLAGEFADLAIWVN